MRLLTIVRHAKSSWSEPELKDFDRPLNKRGLSDAPKMGERLEKQGFAADRVICSPAKRALDTAIMICEEIDYPQSSIILLNEIYDASTAMLQRIIESQPDTCHHIMMVGHNPGFESLCNFIEPQSVARLTTCNIVQYQLNIDHWKDFHYAGGHCLFHLTPKD